MPPFRFNIAQPCLQDWNSMSGGDEQRHCASCDKKVVALAEMNLEDAVALVQAAKPHSLCLRVEHDDAGLVILRKPGPSSNAMPRLMLTIGASLLLNACNEPPAAPATSTSPSENAAAPQSSHQDKLAPPHSTISDKNAPLPVNAAPTEAPVNSATSHPAASAGDRLVKPHSGPGTRITTGCVCAPGDKLCDCL